ncbi:MAG: hypothetical protein NXY57DRAFT_968636 [Lentinula lateritia]|nr:MAG: hypothetical protein NXY57DRAFT_968636 [Lentinula lateritia]
MASTSSPTRSLAATTLLPTSLMEAQVILAGLQSKLALPLFFESPVFQRLQQGDYVPPVLDSQHFPDYNGPSSLPAFSYPRSLVPFCFPPESLLPLSVASGLDLFCSSQMAIQTFQVLTDDSPSTEPPEAYEVFEEAAPFLIYIHDFWIGQANCPLFAEHILATATFLSQGLPVFLHDNLEQQWGIPPDHRSQALDFLKFEQFPAIPIPFCLRFREGSAMMRLVPPKELDPFASLRGQGVLPVAPKPILPPKASNVIPLPPATRTPVVPPRALRRNWEVESLKADASLFLSSPRPAHSKDSDNELLGGSHAIDIVPRASSSSKASSVKMGSKPKASVKVVAESKVSDPTPSATIYKRVRLPPCSRKNAPTTSKGKSWQIIATEEDSTSTEVESEDEDEDEDSAPPPKRLKTTSSISASLPRRSVKRVSVTVKSMPRASTSPLGTPKIYLYCNLYLIVLSRYTYPFILVSPYCLLPYPAGLHV